jgi:hypothetical protein
MTALPAVVQTCKGDPCDRGETIEQLFARRAYSIAEAMMEARKGVKTEPPNVTPTV